MPCRNEEQNIGLTARVALKWVDRLLVYAHCCTDRTIDILETIQHQEGGRIAIYIDPEPQWNEMEHRQFLLEWARQLKATHIAIVDADELLTANLLPSIRGLVEQTPAGQILSLRGVQLWQSLGHYRCDSYFRAKFSLAFLDHPSYAWRPRGQNGYEHHCRPPQPLTEGFCPQVDGGVMHLQFVRWRALRAKQALYQATELLRWPEQGAERIARKYSWWRQEAVDLRPCFRDWWAGYEDLLKHIDLSDDRPSWQERELYRLIDKHGRAKFTGLDFFGIA